MESRYFSLALYRTTINYLQNKRFFNKPTFIEAE